MGMWGRAPAFAWWLREETGRRGGQGRHPGVGAPRDTEQRDCPPPWAPASVYPLPRRRLAPHSWAP